MKRKLDENPKIRASKCRAAWLWNRDGDKTKGGAGDHWITGRGISGKRDGLNRTRQSSQPAQQELPLFIYINPTDVSILPAPSQMLNLNFTSLRIYIFQTGQWTVTLAWEIYNILKWEAATFPNLKISVTNYHLESSGGNQQEEEKKHSDRNCITGMCSTICAGFCKDLPPAWHNGEENIWNPCRCCRF